MKIKNFKHAKYLVLPAFLTSALIATAQEKPSSTLHDDGMLVAGFELSGFGNADKNSKRLQSAFDVGKKFAKSKKDITPEDEAKMGEELAGQIMHTAPLLEDKEIQSYVNNVGTWIALQSDAPDLSWRFGVINTDDVNAFSMPGGIVLITRGMFESMRTEAELAGVLAHEITHVVEKHQVNQIKKAAGNEWKASLIQAVAEEKDNKDSEKAANALTAGMEIYTRGLDKEDEFAADRGGVVLAAKAGYNPYGLVGVLQTLGDISAKDSRVALMFSTHPSPVDRQDKLADAMGTKLDKFADGVDNTERFEVMFAVAE